MNGLVFEQHAPVAGSAPNRADVALFVGFVRRRADVGIPDALQRWLDEQGWIAGPYARSAQDVAQLLDIPVPIEAWDSFDALFAWEQREDTTSTYLGAAVRSFFAQGGRRCYVVRVGDPWPMASTRVIRLGRIAKVIPGYPGPFACSPYDRESWHGLGHLFGLSDVSFICLPDLAEAVASNPVPLDPTPPPAVKAVEQWVECSSVDTSSLPVDKAISSWSAPRCLDSDYVDWAKAIAAVARVLNAQAREVHLIAALPMPYSNTSAARDTLGFLVNGGSGPLAGAAADGAVAGVASAFVQLVYPWVRTGGSSTLPEQLESPDAVLVGVLARNALTRGAYRSAARQALADVYAIEPQLGRDQMFTLHPDRSDGKSSHALIDRVSLVGALPDRLALLSDVTTSLVEAYRPASASRLIATIVRAARRLGEDSVFETSAPTLWDSLRRRLEALLLGLYQDGALDGEAPAQAFQVRCDRSTMTQNDIDNGRLVAEVVVQPALPIQGIRLLLALDANGALSLTAGASGVAA
jgi:Bacteriophage tail sheath protein